MKKILVFLATISIFCMHDAGAQNCPTVRLTAADIIKAGEVAVFTVNVSGGDPAVSPTYNWSISSGSIESGQGTSTIQVNTTGLGGQSITATVELGGFERTCMTSNSYTISVDAANPEAELHINGDYTTSKAFSDDANKFAGDMLTAYYVPQAPRAVIILYPGKNAAAAAALKAMSTSIRTVFAKKGMKTSMYTIVTGGKRNATSYEMWIVPGTAKDPVANPPR